MKKVAQIEDSWVWPDTVQEFVKDHIEGHSLNICAGRSELGDIRVDLDPQNAEVQKADMRELPFEDESFDTVIIDPPWKLGYYQRFRPFYEAVRVCKVGGRIIYNATWVPHSEQCKLDFCVVRRDSHWGNVSVISVFRRISNGA
jgi:ubiquinone/menaquinone biosynthesis C-methylase UbiE